MHFNKYFRVFLFSSFPNIIDFKDLTNEALSRDKEACKQHAFKLFSSSGGTLQPKEGKTVTIWLQAPFKKGQTILKLLFYYGTPAHYPKLRFANFFARSVDVM